MTYTALEALFMLVCIGIGARGGPRAARPLLALSLALGLVITQFALLTSR
jgi:hypothetical protein